MDERKINNKILLNALAKKQTKEKKSGKIGIIAGVIVILILLALLVWQSGWLG